MTFPFSFRIPLRVALAQALALVVLAGAPGVFPSASRANEIISVTVDHAKILRLPEKTSTIVLGNPFIADVALQKSGVVVVTGKSFGTTNMLALDASGNVIAESAIRVNSANDATVVVQRGVERETYSCAPRCEPALRLGDSSGFFSTVGGQAKARTGLANER